MSKEARALLKKINDKKNAIKALVNEGKTKEAKEAKAELVDMQDRFNILMDLEDDEDESIKDQLDKDEATRVEGKDKAPSKKDIARAFVNRIVCGMRKTKMDEKDKKIMDGRFVKSVGGSASTYRCCYYWINVTIVAVALVGGCTDGGAYCGAYVSLNSAASVAIWRIGGSPSCEEPLAA